MVSEDSLENQPIAWIPTAEVIERAQLTRFMKQVGVKSWDELYEYSIRDVERFTKEVLKFLKIEFDPPYDKLLDTSDGVEFPRWFIRNADTPPTADRSVCGTSEIADRSDSAARAGLNITTMCLDRWLPGRGHSFSPADSNPADLSNQPAVIWEGEDGKTETITYEVLLAMVERCAAGLRANGIKQGDAVGIHLPMIPATIISLLGINRVGAIAVPVFSGYGESAIAARLNAVDAKALITCDSFPRRGRRVDALSIAKAAVARVQSIENVFVVETAEPKEYVDPIFSSFQSYLMTTGGATAEPCRTSAEDPLIILYTSGTTGKPKGIAHTHSSFPIKAAQDMAFGTDVGIGTRICWYTDIGWMMGPWLIYGALINGGTICIYDGAPDYPTPDRMWEFCAKHKVEVLGISPTLVRSLAAAQVQTGDTERNADTLVLDHDLSSLRIFASTGEPWNPAPWWWLFEKVGKGKLPIINYSGGTEIAGGILMGNPLLPIKPCSFPAPCPGMDVDILDENGNPVERGRVGELVIKQPWIGMARGFWHEKERYLETYWRRFPGIWVHGDFAMRDKDGHWFILGRSDDTLKVAGKRVGPAEVESILVSHPAVIEAAVIGVPDEVKGTAMVAFVVLRTDHALVQSGQKPNEDFRGNARSESVAAASAEGIAGEADGNLNADKSGRGPKGGGSPLEAELKELIARSMGKPLTPSKIYFVSALPKTRNAKVMRRVIRAAYLGEDPGDLSALENPAAVEQIRGARSGEK